MMKILKWLLGCLTILLFATPIPQQAQMDDTLIAFVSNRSGVSEDIFVTDQQGQQVYNITQSRSRAWHPTWSPDGTRIAYNSDQDGNAEIYVMQANGDDKTNLSNHPASDTSPDWSSTADQIVFISDRDGGFDLYLLDLEDNSTRRLTDDGIVKSEPAWSPDGNQIVYWQQPEQGIVILNVLDIASGSIQTLIEEGQNLWPAWSPDGTEIAYFGVQTGTGDIYSISIQDSTITNITNSESNAIRPDWSSDGNQIIYMDDRDGNFNLYIMNADGSNARRLLDAEEDDLSPTWQPIAAEIEFDSSTALGQNVNVVQGEVASDAQEELGTGERRVFAPEIANIDDIIRIRLEIDVEAMGIDVTPAPTPEDEIPLRSQQALTVYRYMGAQLTGLDIGKFEIFPDPTDYVLQIQEDRVNYWEWLLRANGTESLGENFLAVQIYLPEVQDDGTIIKTVLETITVTVDVIEDQPANPSEFVQQSIMPEEPQGFSIFYSSENSLTVAFSEEIDVSDMRIATQDVEFPVLFDFPIFEQTDSRALVNSCIYYEMEAITVTLPRACQGGQAFSFTLVPGDIFWIDRATRSLVDIIIRKDEQVFVCPAESDRCDF